MKKETLSDKQLSRLLKHDLPPAPQSHWFTRKVLNRLPGRTPSPIERIAYAIGILVSVSHAGWSVVEVMRTGVFTVGMLAGVIAASVIIMAIVCNIIGIRLARVDDAADSPGVYADAQPRS